MNQPHEPLAGWPTTEPYEQTVRPPQAAPLPAVYGQQQPMVTDWVRDEHTGVPVRVLRPAPLAPEPMPAQSVVDKRAQQILAAGAAAPLLGWGGSMLFGALAGATTAIGLLAACLALVWLLRGTGGRQGSVKVNVRVDNRGR